MKDVNTTVVIPRNELDRIGKLLETIQVQSEMIAQLTSERNERLRHRALAAQRRAEVFRIPARL